MKRSIAPRLIAAILVLFAAASCTTKENRFPKPLEYYIGNARPLQGEPLQAEYLANGSFWCHYTPYGFFGRMELPNKRMIHLADLQTGEVICSAVPRGRGPNEVLISPYTDLYRNTLYANDPGSDKVLKVDIVSDTLQVTEYFSHPHSNSAFTINIQAVSDSLFVFFQGTRTGGQIILTDNTGQVLDTIAYPVLDDPELGKDILVNFNVSMALSPCGNWLYVQNYRYNNIRKYSIAENKMALAETYTLLEPKYTIEKGKEKMDPENVIMHAGLFAGEKYIYMPACPETLKDSRERDRKAEEAGQRGSSTPDTNSYLLVFDYDFNLVESYSCDAQFSWVVPGPDPAIIYAADMENHCLRKYTLTGLN